MSLVSRLQSRLHRRLPGPVPEERVLAARIAARVRADRPEPDLAGSTIRLAGLRTVKLLRVVAAEPNAPLLMRLVRHPYALAPGRPVRVPAGAVRPRHQVDLTRSRFAEEVVDLRAAIHPVSAMKTVGDRRAVCPPHPFARTRAEAASGDAT